MSSLTPSQFDILLDVTVVTTALSLGGEIMMFFHYFTDERNRKFPMKGIFCIILSDFIYSLSNLLIFDQDTALMCTIQGYFRELALNAMVMLSTLALYMSYVHLDPTKSVSVDRLYPKYTLYVFLVSSIPANLTLISVFFDGPFYFNHPLGFCDLDPPIYSVFALWIPVSGNLMMSIYFTLKIRRIMKERAQSESYGRRIMIYPLIIVITTIPASIDRMIFTILGHPYFPAILVHITFLRLSGVFNALAYRLTVKPKARGEIRNISLVPSEYRGPMNRFSINDELPVKSAELNSSMIRSTESLENSVIENLKDMI